jgi:hypothetical protein
MPITEEDRIQRVKHICSSDMPCILMDAGGCSVSPFGRTANDVWERKDPNGIQGLVARGLPLVNGETTEAQSCGNMVEDVLVGWAADETRVRFTTGLRPHPDHPPLAWWFTKGINGTHPDGIGLERSSKANTVRSSRIGCEAKLVGGQFAHEWGESGGVDIPLHVEVQVHHQMAVADLERVYVAALICGRSPERRLYCIERDEDWVKYLLAEAEKFWADYVVTGIPPEPNYAPSMPILKARTREPESTVDLGEDAVAAIQAWQYLNKQRLDLEKATETAQRLALATLDDAEAGECDAGTLTYLSQAGNWKVDFDALKKDGVLEKYATKGKHRVLRWKAAKTKG